MPELSSSALVGAGLESNSIGAAGSTGVVTVSVTGVGVSSETAEAVFTTSPPASAMVTTYVPVSIQFAPVATVAHVLEFGVIRLSVTTTLFSVTFPSLVATMV